MLKCQNKLGDVFKRLLNFSNPQQHNDQTTKKTSTFRLRLWISCRFAANLLDNKQPVAFSALGAKRELDLLYHIPAGDHQRAGATSAEGRPDSPLGRLLKQTPSFLTALTTF